MVNSLLELKAENLELVKNRPAISAFRDQMALGAILEQAYITPNYSLKKHNKTCSGIEQIYNENKDRNVIFIGEAGSGKTSAFLRLYMGAGDAEGSAFDKEFFYCYAPDLYGKSKNGSKYLAYYRELRKIIDAGTGLNGILLLDGLEEAFYDSGKKASELLCKLGESDITFWVSCRTNFYHRLDEAVNQYFSETVEIRKWDEGGFKRFIERCLENNTDRAAIEDKIKNVVRTAPSLSERPLFATMILFVAEEPEFEAVHNEYELIELFLDKWLEIEKEKKKIKGEIKFEGIRDVALKLYLRTGVRYSKDLKVFRDLLVLTGNTGAIHAFSHREFLIYFISNALIDAALNNPEKIPEWFCQTFYDDITNMVKPVLARMSAGDSQEIYKNLFDVYKRTYEEPDAITGEFDRLKLLPHKDSFLKLRDEILYFIFRLKNIDHEAFAEYAYKHSTDTMLFLGIAYGMAAIDCNNTYTLEFAGKLKTDPVTPENIRNRGWAMCFFGDVEENGYTYEDSEGKPWKKGRENRLNRLKSTEPKYIATRILDIPLMYCFYHSRGFSDCTSYRDFAIIRDTDISLPCYGEEQKEFLAEQKHKLVSAYTERLLFREISERTASVGPIQREDIRTMPESDKVMLEINEKLKQRLLKQVEYREAVLENLKTFWEDRGPAIIDEYKTQLMMPESSKMNRSEFEKSAAKCKVLIMSANAVEGAVILNRLLLLSSEKKLKEYVCEGCLFTIAAIKDVPVVHVWPLDTAAFTQYGSFKAADVALEYFTPDYVISVGVAFGTNPKEQKLGEVLISRELVFYDNFNKVTDGEIELNAHETYRIYENLEAQLHALNFPSPFEFRWHYGSMLTGGTVLSDADERNQLVEAARTIGHKTIIGGEMEASGIYYACQKIKDRKVPFLVVKGICDWGAVKNGWNEVIRDSKYDNDEVKNCVQAYACNNAFDTVCKIFEYLNFTT